MLFICIYILAQLINKRDSSTFYNYKLHIRCHDHFIKLQRAMKDITRLHSDSARKIVNLTQKNFLEKLLNFLIKTWNLLQFININKKELHNQLEKLYRSIKLKVHFQDTHKQAAELANNATKNID